MEESTNEAQKKSSVTQIVTIAILLVLVGGGFVFASKNKNSNPAVPTNGQNTEMEVAASSPSAQSPTSDNAMVNPDDVRTIKLEAGSFYYKPNEIRMKVGETVKIEMSSVDMMHDFNIDELGVSLPITKSGVTNSVQFTADKAGTFEFYCSVGQHRKNGQVGTLIVE